MRCNPATAFQPIKLRGPTKWLDRTADGRPRPKAVCRQAGVCSRTAPGERPSAAQPLFPSRTAPSLMRHLRERPVGPASRPREGSTQEGPRDMKSPKHKAGAAFVYYIRCAIVHAGGKDMIFESYSDSDALLDLLKEHMEEAAFALAGLGLRS